MKKILFLLMISVATGAAAQNSDYIISWTGMGALKIGTKKADLEKIIGKKITLKNLIGDEGYSDTIKTKYKNIDVQLYLIRQYNEENPDIVLQGIRITSPLCKTKAGIGIGDDKMKIINVYENNTLYIWPDYDDDTFTNRSKTKSVITVSADNIENALTFHLTNKKVVAIEISYSEGGD
jgi:hypothetical protein